MQHCPNENTLSRFIDGDLDSDEKQLIDGHVESCDACQAILESITHDRVAVGIEDQPKTFLKQIAKKVRRQKPDDDHSPEKKPNFLSNESLWPDDYQVLGELGRGGMGIVYEAQQVSLGRSVALKVIPHSLLDNKLSIQRFELEARTAAQLQHEHIVPVYEVGAAESYNWYSMRLINGNGLDQVIKSARTALHESTTNRRDVLSALAKSHLIGDILSNRQSSGPEHSSQTNKTIDPAFEQTDKVSTGSTSKLRPHKSYYHAIATIGQDVAEALAHAHDSGVVHRDIKPSNLLLDQRGKVWVADFGLAKTDDQELTRTGDVVGTLRFLSPERLDGINDRRGDIYSLGMTLYEMLALAPAYDGASQYNVIEKIRNENPTKLQTIDSFIPRDLITIIEKAIEKNPTRRYASAQLMAEDLELFLADRPIRARRVSQWEHLVSWAKRNPVVAASIATVFTLLFAGLIGSTYMAFVFRDMANEQERLVKIADNEIDLRTQELYYAEMRFAQDAANTSLGLSRLRELLNHWIPKGETEKDRRGFEWYWLAGKANMVKQELTRNDIGPKLLDWNPDCASVLWSQYGSVPYFEFMGPPEEGYAYWLMRTNRNGKYVGVISSVFPSQSSQKLAVWDCNQEELVFEIEDESVLGFDFDPQADRMVVLVKTKEKQDSSWFVSSQFRVYSTANWELIHSSENLTQFSRWQYSRIRFHPDGKRLAVCRYDKATSAMVVDAVSTNNWRTYASSQWTTKDQAFWMQWHPDEQVLAASLTGGTTVRWNVGNNTSIESPNEWFMTSIDWHPISKDILLTGNGSISVVAGDTLKLKQQFPVSTVRDVWGKISPNGSEMLISDENGTSLLNLANAAEKVFLNRAPLSPESYYSLFWSPDEKLVSASCGSPLTVWDISNSKRITPENLDYSILGRTLGWNQKGNLMSVHDSKFSIFDESGSQELNRFDGLSDSDHHVDSAGKAKVWPPSEWPGISERAKNLDVIDEIGNGQYLVRARTHDHLFVLALWEPEPNKFNVIYPFKYRQAIFDLAVSPDRKFIAASLLEDGLVILELATGQVRKVDLENAIYALAWSKDNQFLAVASNNSQIKVMETSGYEVVSTFKGAEGHIMDLDWSPDGARLASGSRDKKLTIWDTKSGKSALVSKLDSQVGAVSWSPSGKRLASLSSGGVLRIWDARHGSEQFASDEE